MKTDPHFEEFFAAYNPEIVAWAGVLRALLAEALPDVQEQLDRPAKMMAYCYGQKYAELVCMLIPSQKGLKLGFNRGVDLPDPHGLLAGTGKISRYVEVRSEEQIHSPELWELLQAAYAAYQSRIAEPATKSRK